jgi:hypothetical protein
MADVDTETTPLPVWTFDEFMFELLPEGFIRAADSSIDIDDLRRLAESGPLIEVVDGLFWKGTMTRFGMAPPAVMSVALEVCGPGCGWSGYSAANWLNLTTQVPAVEIIAVPGPAPELKGRLAEFRHWRFVERATWRRDEKLNPVEVAVIEILAEPILADDGEPQIDRRVRQLIDDGAIRPNLIELAMSHGDVTAR